MANRYWVGGTANWDATAGTKWSLTDGGAGGQAVPTFADDVFFTAASGAVTVTYNPPSSTTCKSLDFTGFTGTFANSGSGSLQCYGNITFGSGMTTTYSKNFLMVGTGTFYFTTNGIVPSGLQVGVAGSNTNTYVKLNDTCVIGTISVPGLNCTFDTNDYDLSIYYQLRSLGTDARTILLGSSNINFIYAGSSNVVWNVVNTGLTITSGTSKLNFNYNVSGDKIFQGGGFTYYDLFINGTGYIIKDSNTFRNITIDNTNSPYLYLEASKTQTISDLTTTISGTNTSKLYSFTSGTQATLSKSTGAVSVNYVDIKDSNVTGGATWSAYYSNNISGNSGWSFVYNLVTTVRTYTLSGLSGIFTYARKLISSVGAYILSGKNTVLQYARGFNAQTAVYTLGAKTILVGRKINLIALKTSYTLTGIGVNIARTAYYLVSQTRNYTLVGYNSTIQRGYKIISIVSSYSLAGKNILTHSGKWFTAGVGNFTLSLKNVIIRGARSIITNVASYVLGRGRVELRGSGSWTVSNEERPTNSVINDSKPDTTILNENKVSANIINTSK